MANTVGNVSFGKPKVTGAIYRGILGESLTIPTDATTDLDSDFVCLGYVSDDGLTNTMDQGDDGTKAWGGDTVLINEDSRTDNFKFKLIEVLNEEVLKAVYVDGNVTVTDATTTAPKKISVAVNATEQPECCWVVELLLRDGNPKRIVIPKGKVTEIGDITYKDNEAVGYEITVTGKADGNGNTHYEYLAVGSPVSGT